MKFAINTADSNHLASGIPEAEVDFATKEPKLDLSGKPIFSTQVVVLGVGGAEVVKIKTVGKPEGIAQGVLLKITGLVATTWSLSDGRSGVSFKADRIEPVSVKS